MIGKRLSYEIWYERNGEKRLLSKNHTGYLLLKSLRLLVESYNLDEAERAKIERRAIRERFFIVRAETTLEEVE